MSIYNLLFPARCPFCSKLIENGKPSCDGCYTLTEIPPHTQRLRNGCVCLSAFPHKGVYRKAVLNYKFHNNKQYYRQFAILIKKTIENGYSNKDFDIFTAVPMHKQRLKEKGFNQVALYAKCTAKLLHKPYEELLVQTVLTQAQHTLNREERKSNIKDIYSCIDKADIAGKNILIFDDIVTTGSTLLECTNTLLAGGAESVCCVTINY